MRYNARGGRIAVQRPGVASAGAAGGEAGVELGADAFAEEGGDCGQVASVLGGRKIGVSGLE